jgi:diaminohydroxyphosphoribosylaminopyrimidine deaminase/5-amino-6-(5-phosphoribosylamino)uracil reductase
MSDFSAADARFMARALVLARRGMFTTQPNPRVGCVLVSEGRIVGEGWHEVAGGPHAEVMAINAAGADARGATAYVTLEPCAHHGRTPPCADALIDAGVAAVIVAAGDPSPQVGGQGIDRLEAAGIDVRAGLMAADAEALNGGFIVRLTRGRPFLRLKVAASLDGAIAMRSGESQWITGEDARRDVQRLRAASGAILTGVETVNADDPSLNVRDESTAGRQPLRVVLDSRLRMAPTARLLSLPGDTLVCCIEDEARGGLEAAGASVECFSGHDGRVDVAAVLDHLGGLEINDVLVECGPTLAGELLTRRLVDELVIYQAPHIMGSDTRGIAETPTWTRLADRAELRITDVRRFGRDLRITASPTD